MDHDKLLECLTVVHDDVLRQVQPGVDVAEEITGELATGLEFSVVEQVEEVRDKTAEECVDKPVADSRLQLVEEFRVVNLLKVIVVRLLCEFLNAVV